MEAGQDPGLFWRLTPREIGVIMAGVGARMVREQNDRAWLAWTTAALGRAKKMPKLREMMHRPKAQPRRKTAEEQIAIAKLWTAALARR